MQRKRTERGFTLIEVLVALAIVAVAMAAAVRVAGVMTQGNGQLRERSIALLSAQNRLAELQLEGRVKAGTRTLDCDQGPLRLRCEQRATASADGQLLQVDVQVWSANLDAPPLARLHTLLNLPLEQAR